LCRLNRNRPELTLQNQVILASAEATLYAGCWPNEPKQAENEYLDEYRVFRSSGEGSNALLYDLASKATGITQTGLNFDSNLMDLLKVWAPAADGNQPD
jgi:hypothetical protein